jgi:hypothetical protein
MPRPPRSWAHRIARLDREVTRLPAYTCYNGRVVPERWAPYCNGSRGKCGAKPEYALVYDYVTGRRGRVSSATRHYCFDHAVEAAKRHGIEHFSGPQTTPQEERREIISAALESIKTL